MILRAHLGIRLLLAICFKNWRMWPHSIARSSLSIHQLKIITQNQPSNQLGMPKMPSTQLWARCPASLCHPHSYFQSHTPPLSHDRALMSPHTYISTLAEPGNPPQTTCCSRSKNSNSNSTGFYRTQNHKSHSRQAPTAQGSVTAPFKRLNRSNRTLSQRPWTLCSLIPSRVALGTRTDFRIEIQTRVPNTVRSRPGTGSMGFAKSLAPPVNS